MTEAEREEINEDLTDYAANFCADPTEDEMDARYADHLAELQKSRDLLAQDSPEAVFWNLKRRKDNA